MWDEYVIASERVKEDMMESDRRLTVSVEEAGELLGISRAFAYELATRGDLPCVRLGRRLLVPRKALDELLVVDRREAST